MKKYKSIIIYFILFILTFLTFALRWGINHFGNVSMDSIMFTLNMPLESEGSGFVGNFIKTALAPSIAIIVFVIIADRFLQKKENKVYQKFLYFFRKIYRLVLVLCIWLGTLFYYGNESFGLIDYIKNTLTESTLIKNEYIVPSDDLLSFPKKKKNLIYILMESAETSNQNKKNGGLFKTNYIPEMTQLAKENISFTQSKKKLQGACVAPGCGWTMAGMVTEFAGLPLKLYTYDAKNVDNSMGNYKYFLPGATTIGDLLQEQGYKNYFMCGSDITFGGRDHFLKQHGDYEIFDYNSAKDEGKIASDYKVWWGFEDHKLYDYAKEKVSKLAKGNQPFNFTMLTVDTHHVGGYKCDLCEDTYSENYANVWRCASKQVNEFVNWIKTQDFYKDTTIVIAGDHCSMDPDFYGDDTYDKHHGETKRKVYECFINSSIDPTKRTQRKFTTLDLFPSTLAAMGAKIKGDRLGLGTNLFSNEKTLAEKYGYEELFEELDKKSLYYNEKILYNKDD